VPRDRIKLDSPFDPETPWERAEQHVREALTQAGIRDAESQRRICSRMRQFYQAFYTRPLTAIHSTTLPRDALSDEEVNSFNAEIQRFGLSIITHYHQLLQELFEERLQLEVYLHDSGLDL